MAVLPAVAPKSNAQPDGVAWPVPDWPAGPCPEALEALVARAFQEPALETTYAVVVVQGGRLLAERYGGALPSFTHPPTPVTPETRLLSWSMAKSVLHAAVGILVHDGALALDDPAPVEEWQQDADDPRARITLRHLLEMRDGLEWSEDYVDAEVSDVIEMLFGDGRADVAAYVARKPLAHEPGTWVNYSSGTSNLIARIVGDVVGRGEPTVRFLEDRLFTPLGMDDATVTLDDAGTFIASSFVYCSARSMARFATCYLRGGAFAGREILTPEWVKTAQVPTSADETSGSLADTYYALHWWLDGRGRYWASGHEGQRAVVAPSVDAVVVRYGKTAFEGYPALRAWWEDVLAALA